MEKIKLSILGISYNQTKSGAYALILSEEGGRRRIPIIIGGSEAQAIAIHLEGLKPPRPLTHDLFVSFSEAYNIAVKEIFIYKMIDGVFYSEILFDDGKNRIRVDSRTSDAVALAIRFSAPIYIDKKVIDTAGLEIEVQDEN
nr:bifunctional nuclease family protein [Bacteroidales bacterium]